MTRKKPYRLHADIPFLGDEREERMDAYLPADEAAGGRAGVLVFHGGGWATGSRKHERDVRFAERLVQCGYCVFNVDYALSRWSGEPFKGRLTRGSWPQCVYDCKTAVRYVRKHAATFGIAPARVAVAGGSAGAHLALMVAFTGRSARWNASGLYREEDSSVSCVVAAREISDVRNELSRWLIDPDEADDACVQAMASPLTHVAGGAPPVLLLHGERDALISMECARGLAKRLARFGVEHRLVPVPNEGHELRVDDAAHDLIPVVDTFLRWHLLCR